MRRFGVDPGDLLAAQTTDRVRQLFAFQAERLADYQRRALELLPERDRYAQCSLLVRLELVQTLLAHRLSARVRAYVEEYGSTCARGNRINPYRLALAPIGETRVFKDRVIRRDNSTSVHLLVDSSGSMLTFDDKRVLTRCEAACRCAICLSTRLLIRQ